MSFEDFKKSKQAERIKQTPKVELPAVAFSGLPKFVSEKQTNVNLAQLNIPKYEKIGQEITTSQAPYAPKNYEYDSFYTAPYDMIPAKYRIPTLKKQAEIGGQNENDSALANQAAKAYALLAPKSNSFEAVELYTDAYTDDQLLKKLDQIDKTIKYIYEEEMSKVGAGVTRENVDELTGYEYNAGMRHNARAVEALDNKAAALAQERDLILKAMKLKDEKRRDTFGGQFMANKTVGQLNEEINLAWNFYAKDPSEANYQHAMQLEALRQRYVENNQEALDDEGVKLGWITKDFAGNIDQQVNQFKRGVTAALASMPALIASGGATFNLTKALYTAGVGSYSQDVMRGAAFRTLVEAGADEATAAKLANDEAVLSSFTEMFDTAIDLATLGKGGAITDAIGVMAKKWAGSSAGKKLLVKLAEYGVNIASEGLEEGIQSAISHANMARAESGDTDGGIGGLAKDTGKRIFTGEGVTDAEAAETWDAAKGGMRLAVVSSGATKAGQYVGSNVANAVTGRADSKNQIVADALNDTIDGANEQKNTALNEAGSKNTMLTDSDLEEYLSVGNREHVRNAKHEQINAGESPILTSLAAVKEFIKKSITGKARDTIKGYGKVGTRMAADISKKSGGTVLVDGYYLELDSNRLEHLSDHVQDTDPRNIPLTEDQILEIPEYIDTYDDVLDVVRKKDGGVRILLGKRINGHSVIVCLASKGRSSIQPVTAWQNKTDHYIKLYKNGAYTTSQAATKTADSGYTHAPTDATSLASDNTTVPQSTDTVNQNNLTNPALQAYEDTMNQAKNAPVSDRTKELVQEYGAIDPGETPHRTVSVPKRTSKDDRVSQTIRTVLEAKATPEAAVPTLESLIASGEFSYERYTDKKAMEDAKETVVDLGYNNALTKFTNDTKSGKVSKRNTALGWELYRQAANAGDMESAISILNLMVEHQRNAAQAMQATRILKKMDPDAQLYGVQRSVSNLQQELNEKFRNKAPDLKIDEKLARRFLEAQTDAERNVALQEMYQDIGRQIPATFKEKWDNWRYLAMLANPRTHIRNVVGNAAFMPVRGVGNQISALGQLALPKEQRTRSLGFNISPKRRALLDVAKADFETYASDRVMSGEKYNSATNAVDRGKHIFRFNPLEAARRGNGNLLEWEDKIFSKQAYSSALAGYLNAKGYTAEDFTGSSMTHQQKDEARSFAIKEAQKATYRDSNAFSDLVASIGFKNPKNILESGINALFEGVLPFKKTPANILARSFEYSPAGIVAEGVRATVDGVKNKNFDAVKFIDNMSKGLTGSAVFALGMLLAKWGIIKASPEDEEQEELEGRQEYSLEIDGKSITLDWMAPGVIPLFMGVELNNAIDRMTGGESVPFEDISNVFLALTGPMQNMSMLDGLNSTIESAAIAAQNGQGSIAPIVGTAALNYFTAAFPTVFGQLERTIAKNERVRQTTFIDKELQIPTGLQYTFGRVGNKIPGFDYNQVPYIDAWGRTTDNGGFATRSVDNMANPAYVSDIQETAVDIEIKRLENETGENLTPARVKNNELAVNEKHVFLTEEEFVNYAEAKGQNDFAMREVMMNSEAYKNLSPEAKARAHKKSEDYAKILAMEEIGLHPKRTEWQKALVDADDQTIIDTLIAKAVESEAKAIADDKQYAGYEIMIDNGQINDVTAELLMPSSLQTAYNEGGKGIVSPVEVLDAYSYINADGSDTPTDEKLDSLNGYLQTTYADEPEKMTAMYKVIYDVYPYIITTDRKVPASALAYGGKDGEMLFTHQLTSTQKVGWFSYKAKGGDMVTFSEFLEYANDANSDSYSTRKQKIVAWLNANVPDQRQRDALYYTIYKK